MQEMMLYLQNHYREGIILISCCVILVYLILSTVIMYSCRKAGMRVWATAFIPFYHLILPIRRVLYVRRMYNKEMNTEFEL